MSDTIALVTGAGRGIGKACAEALAQEGFKVAVHCNTSRAPAEELAGKLAGAFVVQGDLSTSDGVEQVFEQVKTADLPLEVLVNNAGVVHDNPIFSASLEDFDRTINTNMRGTWFLTKRAARFMARKKRGRIINISSVIGHMGNPGQSIYGMTKAALDNMTKSLAMELSHFGILVNSVAPGYIETDMTKDIPAELKERMLSRIPLGRVGTPQEVADVVAFLATRAGYCTGAVFHVNGGMYCG